MIKAILFDFDGTLINTNELISSGLQHFSVKYRGNRLSRDEMLALTGRTLEDQMKYIDPKREAILTDQFKIWYAHNHNAKVSIFPGMQVLLDDLKREDMRMAILSNNSRESLGMGIEHLNVKSYFEHILTKEDVPDTKPSPLGLIQLIDSMDLRADEVVYIGDTHNDMIAAQRAGIKSVLVNWTIQDHRTFETKPDFIIEHPSEIHGIISGAQQSVA